MLSGKVRRTKIEKRNSQRDQTQKFIENFIFFLPFLFFFMIFNTSSSNFIKNPEKPRISSTNIYIIIDITTLEIYKKFFEIPIWLN